MTYGQIKQIRELLAGILAVQASLLIPAVEVVEGCQHPEDSRVSLSTFSDPDHWVCRLCQHEHQGFVRV